MRSYLRKISNKYSPIFDAIATGDDDVVNACLTQKSEYDTINEEGYSPLTYAVHRRTPQYVRLFLEKGMPVNDMDANTRTPLMVACRNHDVELVRLLLEKGASVRVGKIINALFERDDVVPAETERILDILIMHGIPVEQ